jgi:hypothetical protein
MKNVIFISFLLTLFSSSVFASGNIEVRLEWDSGSSRVDLDLYVKNPNGDIVNYNNTTSEWGAQHTRDDRGQSNSISYETFTINLDDMDCYATGMYEFHINHYAGPDVRSVITATINGQAIGGSPWTFNTTDDQDLLAVTYNANQSRCQSQPEEFFSIQLKDLEKPRIVGMVDGNGLDYEYIALVVFPEYINQGIDYATHIGVHDSYSIKKIEILESAGVEYQMKISAATSAYAIAQTSAIASFLIGEIPLYGPAAALAASEVQLHGQMVYDLNKAFNELTSQTGGARDFILENPRDIKYLFWVKRNTNYYVPASFEPLQIETYEIAR